jgi:hypothetical protein
MRPLALLGLIALSLTCSACGSRQRLQAPAGSKAIPTAYGAKVPANADQLVQQNAQARPDRSSEPLNRSDVRADDPFDLPPAR